MKKININRVSLSGANELLDVDDVVKFLKKNRSLGNASGTLDSEITVGVSAKTCDIDSPRYKWLSSLLSKIDYGVALHVNGSWSKNIIETGVLPEAISRLIICANSPVRLQINSGRLGETFDSVDPLKFSELANALFKGNLAKFIIQYNSNSEKFTYNLKQLTNKFDVLYDASSGYGITAKEYKSLYADLYQGYAGGLAPNNLKTQLNKLNDSIDLINTSYYDKNIGHKVEKKEKVNIWIDAEKRIREDERNVLDLNKAQKFVDKALAWKLIGTVLPFAAIINTNNIPESYEKLSLKNTPKPDQGNQK